MEATRKPKMSREEATKLYENLKKNMEARYGKDGLAALLQKERSKTKDAPASQPNYTPELGVRVPGRTGMNTALLLVLLCACAKLCLSAFEAFGILSATPAIASIASVPTKPGATPFSREEVRVLSALDSRRVELDERRKKLDVREEELSQRDREFAAKLTQLRELTEQLNADREKNERKRSAQLDQLANVYGSMDPKEAATLMEQLDVMIALSLIERMPEKRIGQILALMSPDRALTITKMLSGKS